MATDASNSGSVLRFLGGAGTVTGSRFLLSTPRARVMIDCGLYQGIKPLRLRNWEPFPVDPADIDAILLTHAHLDHSGYLPRLRRLGFSGPVFATRGTAELSEIVLRDSGRLQEEQAAYANRKAFSKHHPALALYTEGDAEETLALFREVAFEEDVEVTPGVHARWRRAGHILGSAIVQVTIAGGPTVTVSGDLGRPHHPVLQPPAPLEGTDALLVESTYGDRKHDDDDARERFASAIQRTAARGGVVVIPAFAVDRTEVVLLELRHAMEAGVVPRMPVYVDSPMALAALGVYRTAIRDGWDEIHPALRGHEDPFDPGNLIEAHSVRESRQINDEGGPAIIVSASGMATGGRVLHHLEQRLPHARNTILLAGYQAAGTRGRRLLEGERALKLLGRYVPVRAEVVDVNAFSVHADRDELLGWLGTAPEAPETTFVVHGEEEPARALRESIERQLDWVAVVPKLGEQVRLDRRP